eukprot:CAMPEP_0181301430 /NCGR_PEP_ID=MMETSP1101-20121128/7421_1 /TAXON_ID=46948 /ORGANISM="Rhodomonas abbreviata, Strain Caron Lab Isolate" /LENGTH=486 /DNA_ID=CAMNT_0023406737 /DNA_START=60 /DNA_END=1520 /DNA_ORIENTATION=+
MSELLDTLKTFLASPPTAEVRTSFLATVPLDAVLQLLGDASSIETVCQCLSKLLGGDHAEGRAFFFSPQGSTLVPAGLSHGNALVRRTSIELLSSKMFDDEWLAWLRREGVLLSLIKAVSDPSIQVSNAASSALLKAASTPAGIDGIFTDHMDQLTQQIVDDSDSTIQLRVLELVCRMWQLSPDCTRKCKETPARGLLVSMCESDDILLQLNAVEIIALLPPSEIGRDIMPKLAEVAQTCGEPVVVSRLLECICRFVADLPDDDTESVTPELEATLHMIMAARLATQNTSRVSQEAADTLNALAVLCSSARGALSLEKSGHAASTIAVVASSIQSLHQPLRLAALDAAQRILRTSSGDAVVSVLEKHMIPLVAFLLGLARGPVQEEKIGALCVFRSLAQHAWGLRSMFAQSEFLPFLTDRRLETLKVALDEKFEIAKNALSHPELEGIVGQDRKLALANFVAQGAYYTAPGANAGPSGVHVATEHL